MCTCVDWHCGMIVFVYDLQESRLAARSAYVPPAPESTGLVLEVYYEEALFSLSK